MEKITGKDIGGLLAGIQVPAECLLDQMVVSELPRDLREILLRDPDEMVFRKSDLLDVLRALGLPEPEWTTQTSVKRWLRCRSS